MIDNSVAWKKLRYVILHIFLKFPGQVAQAKISLLVIPRDDFDARTFLCVLFNPRGDLVVSRARGDKRFERLVLDLGELEPSLVQRTIGVIFPLNSSENGTALIHSASGQDITAERGTRTPRVFLSVSKVGSQ